MKPKMVTRYALRIRFNDNESWGEPTFFDSRKKRDKAASLNRITGGLCTFTYAENVPAESASSLAAREGK